ncbi:hypothetical protein A7X68_09560 [Stenotrophomonas maltophilia]|nr:hypothetical protein AS591_21795 [Stenotrophomonas maltophilia]PZS59772.1 hypothetical protein A7X58_06915 [Stenotrophomonas maltophilia]PZS67600.1 hypothetical protein A7X68_09560 [Stenotrophomonas maltophilia]
MASSGRSVPLDAGTDGTQSLTETTPTVFLERVSAKNKAIFQRALFLHGSEITEQAGYIRNISIHNVATVLDGDKSRCSIPCIRADMQDGPSTSHVLEHLTGDLGHSGVPDTHKQIRHPLQPQCIGMRQGAQP